MVISDQETEIRGSDLVVRIEIQRTEDRERVLSHRFDFRVVFHALDFHELPEISDCIERYCVLTECVLFSLLFDDGCRRESEAFQDGVHRFTAVNDDL